MIELSTAATVVRQELQAAVGGNNFPQLLRFTQRFRQEFTPQLFHYKFWSTVNEKLGLPECPEGHGDKLFFRMREKYRSLQKYPYLEPDEQRRQYPGVVAFLEAVEGTELV